MQRLPYQGRILADTLLYNIIESKAESDGKAVESRKIIIETGITALDALKAHLSAYRLRSNVKISNGTDKYATYVELPESYTNAPGNKSSGAGSSHPQSLPQSVVRVIDPRTPTLGTRILAYKNCSTTAQTSSSSDDKMQTGEGEYSRFLMLQGVLEGPDLANRIPLECNMDLLNYMDFKKGCYVGQELMARTKFKV
jgi:folate-binding protein YgfZ